jgi:hydroxymethylbilane synthase
MSTKIPLTIGSHTSNLAMWQTNHVISLLEQAWPGINCQVEPFIPKGDNPLPQNGNKGLFTLELEDALRNGRIDFSVHPLKDIPVKNTKGVILGAMIGRADARDVIVSKKGKKLGNLPIGAVVGTNSLRRQAQLRQSRPDLDIQSIRGNVETRILKVKDGPYDATILAAANISHLGLDDQVSQWLPINIMLPAPGQGALAVQCRANDDETIQILSAIHQPEVATAVIAERSFLHHVGGDYTSPVSAYAAWKDDELHLTGLVSSIDGTKEILVTRCCSDSWMLGKGLANEAIKKGAREILATV